MSVHSSSSRGLQVDMSMFTVVGSAYLAYIPRGVMERLKMYLKHKLGHEQRLPRWSVQLNTSAFVAPLPQDCGIRTFHRLTMGPGAPGLAGGGP